MLIWAAAGIAVKEALILFQPLTLIVIRFTIAVLLMLIIGLIFRNNDILGLQHIAKKDIPLFILGGVFQPFLYFIFETYTYQSFTSPTIAEALLSTQPVLAPIFAFVLLKERVTRNNIFGILISTIGVLMLLLIGNNDYAMGSTWGVLLAILTVSMSVSYSVILRKIPTHYSPITIVFYVQTFALLLFYILWGGTGEYKMLLNDTTQLLHNTTQLLPNTTQLLHSTIAVLYLAVFASVAAFVFFCYTVRHIGVTRANVFNNIRPVFTALLMGLLFGEVLPLAKWMSILLIITGLFITQRNTQPK